MATIMATGDKDTGDRGGRGGATSPSCVLLALAVHNEDAVDVDRDRDSGRRCREDGIPQLLS